MSTDDLLHRAAETMRREGVPAWAAVADLLDVIRPMVAASHADGHPLQSAALAVAEQFLADPGDPPDGAA